VELAQLIYNTLCIKSTTRKRPEVSHSEKDVRLYYNCYSRNYRESRWYCLFPVLVEIVNSLAPSLTVMFKTIFQKKTTRKKVILITSATNYRKSLTNNPSVKANLHLNLEIN